MVDPLILSAEACKMIKEYYEAAIYAGPTCIFNLCCKFEYR